MVRKKPEKTKKKKQNAGGTITPEVAKRLGKRTATQEFDRAVKSRTGLSAVKEAARKKIAIEKGIPFVPATRAPQVFGTPVEDIPVPETEPTKPTDPRIGTPEDAARILQERGIETEMMKRTNQFLAESQGLSTFDELRLYQQFLVDIAQTGGVGSIFRATGESRAFLRAISKRDKATLIGREAKAATTSAGAFPTNTKTQVLSGKMLLKRGVAASVVALIGGSLGSYPFAGFIKEETIQALTFKSSSLREAGLLDEAEIFLQQREAVHEVEWQDFVPFANVMKNLFEFFQADISAIRAERKLIEKDRKILAGEEVSQFDKLRKGSKEAERGGVENGR